MQDIKYYVMKYTTHDGRVCLNLTNRRDVHERNKVNHPNREIFEFWEVDRFTIVLSETDGK